MYSPTEMVLTPQNINTMHRTETLLYGVVLKLQIINTRPGTEQKHCLYCRTKTMYRTETLLYGVVLTLQIINTRPCTEQKHYLRYRTETPCIEQNTTYTAEHKHHVQNRGATYSYATEQKHHALNRNTA